MRYNLGRHWERWGRDEPYFGVFSSKAHRRDALDDATLAAFFASGEAHMNHVLAWAREEAGPGFSPGVILDHGCGVGRVTIPFARAATRVVAVDVSPSMLAEAQRNCSARGVTNVELVEARSLDELRPEFDLVHSALVLQHVHPSAGLKIAERLAWLVRPGGAGVIHVPLAAGNPAERTYQWVRRNVPFAHQAANLVRGRAWSHPDMQMHAYPVNKLLLRLRRRGIGNIRVVLDMPADEPPASCVLVFARPR